MHLTDSGPNRHRHDSHSPEMKSSKEWVESNKNSFYKMKMLVGRGTFCEKFIDPIKWMNESMNEVEIILVKGAIDRQQNH